MIKIGAHVSSSGGVFNAPLNAHEEKLETFQMFSRPPQTYKCPELTDEMVEKFISNCKKYSFEKYYIHAPYLINLASADNRIRHASITMLRQELDRGSRLKVAGVMFHTGSAASQPDREEAINVAIQSLNQVMEGYDGDCKLLLENAAGSGKILGCSFEEIAELTKGIKINKSKVGFCLDTQHAFASGYDMRTAKDVDGLVAQLDKYIGLKKLAVIQVNDSKVEFNSKKDRHEHIKLGYIGKEGMGFLVNHPKLQGQDFILETPPEGRPDDVKILKKLRS
ncbi:MAG: deoxyribonuclease IV [bacterium]|nr:deoxyribonuclease IV [bacterium]